MLEEPTAFGVFQKPVAIDEDVRVFWLTGPAWPGCPRAAEPQPRVAFDQAVDERALADAAGANDNQRETFAQRF